MTRQLFQFFVHFVCSANVFWACSCVRIEDLDVKEGLRESILPQTICSNVEAGIVISCGSSICEGFALQSLKTRLDFDIVAYFVQIGEGITDVIVSDVGVTTFRAMQCVGYCEWFVASTVTRKFNWFPSVSQRYAVAKFTFC